MKRESIEPYPHMLLRTKTCRETFETLSKVLENHKKVYYSRFGDGDVVILMGKGQANHDYDEQLARELKQALTIEHPLFLIGLSVNYPHERGMSKGLFERFYYNDQMQDFLIEILNISRPVVFENSFFPSYITSFYPREMNRFLDRYIRPKKKMFIGSVPRTEIEKLLGEVQYYVETPRKNAYASIDAWWPEIRKNIDSVELVIPAAGMATRVISKRLWELNCELHCIDIGSIVDAVSSFKASRKWIKLKRHVLNRVLLPEYRDRSVLYWLNYGFKETGLFFRYHYYRLDPLHRIPIFPKAKNWIPGPKKFKT